MFEMKISDIRNNKTTVAVVIVLMIFSLPSNLIFITSTEDLTYCSAVQDFYLLPPASLLHYEFTGNQITSQLAVQSSLGVTLQHFSFARGGPLLSSPLLSLSPFVYFESETPVSGIDWHQRKYLENIHFACWKSQYFCYFKPIMKQFLQIIKLHISLVCVICH